MFPDSFLGGTVHDVLGTWALRKGLVESEQDLDSNGLAVLDFKKWTVGERLDAIADSPLST